MGVSKHKVFSILIAYSKHRINRDYCKNIFQNIFLKLCVYNFGENYNLGELKIVLCDF